MTGIDMKLLVERIKDLERRVSALETRGAQYGGVTVASLEERALADSLAQRFGPVKPS